MNDPIFRTAAEAWAHFVEEIGDSMLELELSRSIFMAGMVSAMLIAYHYGTVDVRAEIAGTSLDHLDAADD